MKKTKIILKDLAFFARHGLINEEAKLGQRFKVDVTVELKEGISFEEDCPSATANYVDIYNIVKEAFELKRYNLIEACAEAIARRLLNDFNVIDLVNIKIKKPSVPVDCICEYFAAEITLCR